MEIDDLVAADTTISADVVALIAQDAQSFADLEAAVKASGGTLPPQVATVISDLQANHTKLVNALLASQAADATTTPVITSNLNPSSAPVNQAFIYQITATGSPTSFAASNLPAGLTVDTVKGVISGTPTAAGTSVVGISATNAAGVGTANLSLTFA